MSVTKILFKQGASVPSGSQFATQGEPLWRTGANELYVTNGTNNPTLIGPFTHSPGAIIIPANTNITGSTPVTGVSDGYLTGTADTGYAIGGLTIDSTGHVVALTAVALPSAGSTVSVTQVVSTGTKIATITINGQDTDLYAPNGGGTTGRDDELTAVEHNTTTPDGSVDLKTAAGNNTVNLKHKAQTNNAGTYATFEISQNSTGTEKIVEMEIVEINGGTWS